MEGGIYFYSIPFYSKFLYFPPQQNSEFATDYYIPLRNTPYMLESISRSSNFDHDKLTDANLIDFRNCTNHMSDVRKNTCTFFVVELPLICG